LVFSTWDQIFEDPTTTGVTGTPPLDVRMPSITDGISGKSPENGVSDALGVKLPDGGPMMKARRKGLQRDAFLFHFRHLPFPDASMPTRGNPPMQMFLV
jgi:hypothetical protein